MTGELACAAIRRKSKTLVSGSMLVGHEESPGSEEQGASQREGGVIRRIGQQKMTAPSRSGDSAGRSKGEKVV